jgi:hypothetical protein
MNEDLNNLEKLASIIKEINKYNKDSIKLIYTDHWYTEGSCSIQTYLLKDKCISRSKSCHKCDRQDKCQNELLNTIYSNR